MSSWALEEGVEQRKVVLLWDKLKEKLRKSEEDEFARLIGRETIEKLEVRKFDSPNSWLLGATRGISEPP